MLTTILYKKRFIFKNHFFLFYYITFKKIVLEKLTQTIYKRKSLLLGKEKMKYILTDNFIYQTMVIIYIFLIITTKKIMKT